MLRLGLIIALGVIALGVVEGGQSPNSRKYKDSKAVPRHKAFTLVELLVVIAIIAILVLLLLPAVNAARETARRAPCINNIRQVGFALINFESTHRRFPPSRNSSGGWYVQARLLPFLEENVLADDIDFDQPSGGVVTTSGQLVSSYRINASTCPSESNDRTRYKEGPQVLSDELRREHGGLGGLGSC